MKTPSLTELEPLMQVEERPCISIYMPRHRTNGEAQQDQVLAKNLLRNAEELLLTQGWHTAKVEKLLNPARELFDNGLFWRERADGLALFVSPHRRQHYPLPIKPNAHVVVAHHFFITPLLALQDSNRAFYVLSPRRNQVRLWQGTRYSIEELKWEGVPQNLEQALGYKVTEKQSSFRPLPASVGGGGRQAIFYGQGGEPEDTKDKLTRYFRVLDRALRARLEQEQAPLVLAVPRSQFPIYREVNTYPQLVDEMIEGNPEQLSPDQIRTRAWEIVQPEFERAQVAALARYAELIGTGLASSDLEEIVPAAHEGRVQVLFLDPSVQKWGSFDGMTRMISVQPLSGQGGEELLNLSAIQTLLNNGKVYAIEQKTMPEGAQLAAIFRY